MMPDLFALVWITNLVSSLVVFTILFALVYRALPDTQIPWTDLWLGAAITAVLFTAGKSMIGLYLGTSGVTSAYGAAGSFVLILLWVYYSAVIFLFGAEITRAYSEQVGSRARATDHGAGNDFREPEAVHGEDEGSAARLGVRPPSPSR
jgi:membrane protein